MAKRVIHTQVRFDNSSNVTYVVKTFNDGTYLFTVIRQISGCYRLVQKKTGICGNPIVV